MEELHKHFLNNNRRNFLKKAGLGIGGLALGSLLDPFNFGKEVNPFDSLNTNSLNLPHFAPKAKRIIYLFQSGGPSQLDLFDYKPKLNQLRGIDLPESGKKLKWCPLWHEPKTNLKATLPERWPSVYLMTKLILI